MRKLVRSISVAACVAAMLGASALQAASRRSVPIDIPFAFKASNQMMPVGTYTVRRGTAEGFATLVNVKTGQRVQVLSPLSIESTKTRLVFERDGDRFVLKSLS